MALAMWLSADTPDSTWGPVSDDARYEAREAERALVSRVRDGDADAFATLVQQYLNRVTRFAHHILGSHDAAEDVVQHVWVQLWERRASLDPERPLKPYLFKAIRNRALDDQKSAAVRLRHRTVVQAELASGTARASVESPERVILETAAIQAAVDQLSERRRLALRLRVEEEMTHAEIAEALGVSAVAAQSLVARAVSDLRDILRRVPD